MPISPSLSNDPFHLIGTLQALSRATPPPPSADTAVAVDTPTASDEVTLSSQDEPARLVHGVVLNRLREALGALPGGAAPIPAAPQDMSPATAADHLASFITASYLRFDAATEGKPFDQQRLNTRYFLDVAGDALRDGWQDAISTLPAGRDAFDAMKTSVEERFGQLSSRLSPRPNADAQAAAYRAIAPDSTWQGTVVKKTGYGLFVELKPNVVALAHISDVPGMDQVRLGQTLPVKVTHINAERQRIQVAQEVAGMH